MSLDLPLLILRRLLNPLTSTAQPMNQVRIESQLTHSKQSLNVQHSLTSFIILYLHLARDFIRRIQKVAHKPPPIKPSSSSSPPSSPSQFSSNLSHAPPPFAPNALLLPTSPLLYLLLLACLALRSASCWSSSRWILAPHCWLLLISAGKADKGCDGVGEDTVSGGLLQLWRGRGDLFCGRETIWGCILAAMGSYFLPLSSWFEVFDYGLAGCFNIFLVMQVDECVGTIQEDGHICRH